MSKMKTEAFEHLDEYLKSFHWKELKIMMNMTGLISGKDQYRNYHVFDRTQEIQQQLATKGLCTYFWKGDQIVYQLNDLGLCVAKYFRGKFRTNGGINYLDIKGFLGQ